MGLIDRTSAEPLYLQIQNRLVEQIRAGEFKPGEQVPSELEIAARYSVSRMTGRKALDELVSRGLLFRRKGKGTFVADSLMSYSLSTMLSFSKNFRARGYHVVTKVLLIDVIPPPADLVEKLQLHFNTQVIVIRRLRFVEGKPAAIHTSFLEYRAFAPLLDMDLSSASLLDAIENISGIRIAYTRDSVCAASSSLEDADLLRIEMGSPVLRVEGIAYSANSWPIRLTRAVYRGDLFRLEVLNTTEQADRRWMSSVVFADPE